MFGDITVKSRPLRLAFLIPPDKAMLRKAIQVNSTLWGGTYNPIIVLYAQSPKTWKMYPGQKILMRDRIAGYIRAFDPDILVDCTNGKLPSYVSEFGRRIVRIDEIWSNFPNDRHDGVPRYGVGVFELLNAICKEFFDVVRRFPSKVLLPVFPKELALFWAANLGEIMPPIQEAIEANYAPFMDIEKLEVRPNNFTTFFELRAFSPRTITRYKLKTEIVRSYRNDAYAFYMDATKLSDIVDFWNLRALGRSVIPIPKQFIDIPEYIGFVQDFVRDHYSVNRHNPAITHGTSLVRSFSSTMGELEEFAKRLEVDKLIPDTPDARSLYLQHWYPRIWDEWAMGKDGATPDNVSSRTEEFSFSDVKDTVTLNLVSPDFVADTLNDTSRFANEIYPKFYGNGENILADVLPYDHGNEVLRVAGGSIFLRDEYRIGRTGLIHLIKWKYRFSRWKLPFAEDVFFAWLQDKGFIAELSTCGRLARQMHSQLRGWLSVLTNEPLLAMFERMNKGGDDGKGLPLGGVKNELKRIAVPGADLYRSLVERGLFQLGYKTQCTHCERSSWYSLSALAAELTCPLCLKKLDAISAVDSNNQGAWHLRTAGPFSVGNYADGSYSVLLALNFFEQDRSLQMTPVLSFAAKHNTTATTLEADLGLLWQETVLGETQDGVLFVECKSYNKFERRDYNRMETLAKEFPGAILAFCTLRKKLDSDELREIRRIAKSGMKRWKAERPINPVLVLTGHELFSHVGAPQCWDGISIPDWAKRTHTLLELCNATQGIHLGLPHWHQTWHKEFEKRRSRKRKNETAGTVADR